jgi:SAM-dependent methyltransferase
VCDEHGLVTFDLDAIVARSQPPAPWAEGEKIPWDDPAFSERMLAEHLSQAHDAASRRVETIEAQVRWIHESQLGGAPARVLDLGCGPGLYANRLARLGHAVHGIDFAPASIRYARAEAEREFLSASYQQADIRDVEYGDGFDLAMLLYGEFNVFTPDDALLILERARTALRPGGRLLLEPHTFEVVRSRGESAPSWYTSERGLFSDVPHVVLSESWWDEDRAVATQRWFVIDAATAAVERYADAMQAYTDAGYVAILEEAGFREVTLRPDWPSAAAHEEVLRAYTARS